ncbi:cwf18 pre-mRNA splicing factor [Biscogniauxia mediterranea]|nr:cwf18 pre-mRNA splicing factor [Biscogniauxia mediterranea]
MSSSHAALSAASDDRKARLAKLKTLKRKQPADEVVAPESTRSASPPTTTTTTTTTTTSPTGDVVVDTASHDVARLHLSGRNYDASARGAKLGFEAPPTLGLAGPTLEEQAEAVAREAAARAAADARDADRGAGIDLFKLQPRKPNWDLRRDLDRKLEVLNVRTDNAIARLVRERIAAAQAAAHAKKEASGNGSGSSGNGNGNGDKGEGGREDGEAAGMDGVALVEGLRVREREEEEEERREREEQEAEDDV